MNTTISEVENKIPDRAKYNTAEYNKLTAENFTARSNQSNLVIKTDFDNKITSFSKQITANKAKHLEFQKKLNSIIASEYNFFLGRTYLASNVDLKTSLFINQYLICSN